MLIEKNIKNSKDSIYECDRCKTRLNFYTRYQLSVAKKGTNVRTKYADLCGRCMRALDRGMKKGKQRS